MWPGVAITSPFSEPISKTSPVLEQVIEFRSVAGNVLGVEDGAEDLLHLADALADGDRRAGLELDVGGAPDR